MKKSLAAEQTKLALYICLVVCLASSIGVQAEDRFNGGVKLHREANYQGVSETFYTDVPDLRGSSIGNDQASSVSLGDDCQARLYANANYTGAYLQIAFGVADLRGSRVGNNAVSSMKVRCGGAHWGDSGSGSSTGGGISGGGSDFGATLYRDLGFSGTSQTFTDDVSDLRRSYVGNDTVTSVRVSRGCRARLYADMDFRGAHIEVDRDISDLRGSAVGNDAVTSMRVHCEGSGAGWNDGGGWGGGNNTSAVTLYRDLDFSGRSQTITSDISDLRGHYVGNDTATSVRIDHGCRARLYVDANYQGSYLEMDRDISDLRGSSVGNDTVTSVQVRCDGNGGGWSGGTDWSDSSEGWDGGSATDGVTLFRDLGFSGRSQSFTADISDLRGSYVGNDSATSVRVGRGCRARLYADANYRGAYIEVDRDVSDLRGSRVGNDTVTSMQVRCDTDGSSSNSGGGWGDGDSGQGTSDRVTLYQDTNFRGAAYSFDSDVGDLRSAFGANDDASSVRVAPGCTVRLYQDPQFRGDYTETSRDISDLRSSRVGNDSTSSLQVRCR